MFAESVWQPGYYGLLLMEKMVVVDVHALSTTPEGAQLWDAAATLLLHPHMWIRKAASRLLGRYLANCDELGKWAGGEVEISPSAATKEREGGLLMQPGKLMQLSRDVCQQVEAELLDDSSAAQIVKNLVGLVRISLARSAAGVGDGDPKVRLALHACVG